MRHCFVLFTIITFGLNACIAQNETAEPKKSVFRVDASYLSNAVYSGRRDSAVIPYLNTIISYIHKSGVYVGAGTSTLVSPTQPVRSDLFWLNAGYDFSIGEKVNAGFDVAKTFYSSASVSVRSEEKGEAGGYASVDANILSINGSFWTLFSQGVDITTSLGLSHPFYVGPEDKQWTIEPAFNVGMGSQNFYEAYYQNRRFTTTSSGRRRGRSAANRGSGSTPTVSFKEKTGFKVLDYELSLPIRYESSRYTLYAKPVYAIPVNPESYVVDNKLQKEPLSNSFFFEIGGYINF